MGSGGEEGLHFRLRLGDLRLQVAQQGLALVDAANGIEPAGRQAVGVRLAPKMPQTTNIVLGGDSLSILSTIVLSKNRSRFPLVSGGFLERFGSLERMEMESTPRIVEGLQADSSEENIISNVGTEQLGHFNQNGEHIHLIPNQQWDTTREITAIWHKDSKIVVSNPNPLLA